ncbi:MAG: SRPBCC family protein [Bacteroidia bacterium]
MITTLIIIGSIIVLFLLTAALMSKQMTIERSIVIHKPVKEIFDYVKLIRNHDNFSPYAMMDPEMKKEYRGTDGQPGFVFAWDSTKNKGVGAGEQEIREIHEGRIIEHELRFMRPMEGLAQSKFMFESSGNGTKVTWGFYSPMKFPMNIMKSMFENNLGKNQIQGLETLKKVLEKA